MFALGPPAIKSMLPEKIEPPSKGTDPPVSETLTQRELQRMLAGKLEQRLTISPDAVIQMG